MQTRRDFLHFLTMLTGAAGLSESVPEAILRAYAIRTNSRINLSGCRIHCDFDAGEPFV